MTRPLRRAARVALLINLSLLLFFLLFLLLEQVSRGWGALRLGACYLRDTLHVYCPGCGGTRAVLALAQGRLWDALVLYPALFVGILTLVWYDGTVLLACIRRRPAILRLSPWWISLLAPAAAVVFCIVRNVLAYTVGYDPLGDLTALLRLFLSP
ncbi:MAG: DUF2752 domain-containing protein [Clostridia bacterium]|nr:DUF2752 domain-containing protein [Clostridia bacterium]